MGIHMSKNKRAAVNHQAPSPSSTTTTVNITSYEAACKLDTDLQSFDTSLQARTNNVINSIATGVEVHAVSFDSLKEATECLLDMDQEVVKVILHCKNDIWGSQHLFEHVEDYFGNTLKTLDFCTALEKCLNRARDSQLLIHVALNQFQSDHDEIEGNERYVKILEELKAFKQGDPFTDEFFQIFQSVCEHHIQTLEKLQAKKNKLDKKLRYIHAWRKVSSIILASTFAAVLICSVVAAAIAAPPVAAALSAATAIPMESIGNWIDSIWGKYESEVKGQKQIINSMNVGTCVAIKDLDNIRVLIDTLENEIKACLENATFATNVKVGVGEIKKNLEGFMRNIEELGVQAANCSRDIRKARTVILQRIIKHPHH